MQNGSNRRLANVKTRKETGLDYVMLKMDIISPFGKKKVKEIRPFFPGDEFLYIFNIKKYLPDINGDFGGCTSETPISRTTTNFFSDSTAKPG